MKIVLLLTFLILAACSHAGEPNQESSSQDEAKGAFDEPGFVQRMFGQEPVAEEPDLTIPKKKDSEDEKKSN